MKPDDKAAATEQWLVVYRATSVGMAGIYTTGYDDEQIDRAIALCEEEYGARAKVKAVLASKVWAQVSRRK
ncbi:MAG: hypothetical protein JST59_20345 [Actinobacteria bacterium]|nr:hypothetical protein [Actinomycetota bacterium]